MKSFLFNPLPEGAGKPGAPAVDYWASATHSKTPRDGAAWLLKQYAVRYCLVPPAAVTYSPRTRADQIWRSLRKRQRLEFTPHARGSDSHSPHWGKSKFIPPARVGQI